MSKNTKLAPVTLGMVLSDLTPLLEQIGSPAGLVWLGSSANGRLEKIADKESLSRLVERYCDEILFPIELPSVLQSFKWADAGGVRELLALDASLGTEPRLRGFNETSRLIGQYQLRRLQPLRDQRLVQRFLQAVEQGTATGWHTIVFGIILSVFSLPLRQGLIHFAQETIQGLLLAASRTVRLGPGDREEILDKARARLPEAVQRLMNGTH